MESSQRFFYEEKFSLQHTYEQGGMPMKKQAKTPDVLLLYEKEGKPSSQLVKELFLQFVEKELKKEGEERWPWNA